MPPTPRSTTKGGLTGAKEAGTGGGAQGGNLCNGSPPKGGEPNQRAEGSICAQCVEPQSLWSHSSRFVDRRKASSPLPFSLLSRPTTIPCYHLSRRERTACDVY